MHLPPWPQSGAREAELLQAVLESPQWGGFHPFVKEFEQSFAAYQQAVYGISTFNGTVSLELALAVLGIGPGDEVIVPAISFISSATAVSRLGATPVFVDIQPYSFNVDADRVRDAITPRTKAIMAVHFGGAMCQMDILASLCRDRNLLLLEDAAHAQGSEWNGRRAGSFGIAGSFSFQNGKVLCSGEGGMLVASDACFAERCQSLANCGRIAGRSFYEHHRLGTNFRLTAFQAAVLIAQLERLPEQIRVRGANARLLKALLADVPEIVWQEQPPSITQNSWYLMLGRVRKPLDRDDLVRDLKAGDLPCGFYPHTLYQNPLYRQGGSIVTPCPVAEACIQDAFWLPHRVLLADQQAIGEVADLIRGSAMRQRERAAKVEPVWAR